MARAALAEPVGDFGHHVRAFSSIRRPDPLIELGNWGGVDLVRGKRVLDLGCGDGRLALGIAPYAKEVDGLDPDAEMIAAARKAARSKKTRNVRFKVGAAQRLPYRDAVFDVVVLSWTL